MPLQPEDFKRQVVLGKSQDNLSAEEGFMLSRLGSGLCLKELLSLCPWPENQSLALFEGLLKKNSLAWLNAPTAKAPTSEPKIKTPSKSSSTPALEEKTELPDEVKEQLQIDQFEAATRDLDKALRTDILLRLHKVEDRNPYEILGVKRTATQHEIKSRYMELSRKFHPDRFFRKELGPYKRKLDQLFTHIQHAYQALKNPHDREVLDRKLKMKSNPGTTPANPRKLDPKFEKIGKADHHYRLGLESQKKGDLIAAYNAFQIASQLNPQKEIYAKAAEELQPYVQAEKAKSLVKKAEHFLEIGLFNDALAAAREAVKADPESGEAAFYAAKAIVELGLSDEMEDAFHFLRRAKTKMAMDPEPCILLGRLHQARRDKTKAKHEYEAALKRDPQHSQAKKLLSKLES